MQMGHLDAVLRNETRAYAYPWTDGIFRDCMAGEQDCWSALVDGNVVGHAVFSVSAGESHLLNLCISRDFQGIGCGRKFVEFVIERVTARQAEVMFLEVRPSNSIAIALYESLGFAEVGTRPDYYPTHIGREDAKVYALQISARQSSGAGH
jgi:ribosomal-protein-alanine N-acetyltransferase